MCSGNGVRKIVQNLQYLSTRHCMLPHVLDVLYIYPPPRATIRFMCPCRNVTITGNAPVIWALLMMLVKKQDHQVK